jgi:hypothetical protein
VYSPEAEIDPPLVLHVTAVLLVPVTVAVSCWLPPGATVTELGFREIEMEAGELVTVTAAEAVLVVSALLVAVTL